MAIQHFAFASIALSLAQLAAGAAPSDNLTTLAEQTGDRRTGRYEEVERLCPAFQQRWPKQVRCVEVGRTPEGRPMLALIASADGTLDPEAARRAGRPIVLMQGGIHAGEIDGKDAGLRALRHMLEGKVAKNTLNNVTLVFVPVFNADGHERFGRWNRPNQVGPEEMGWRTTSQNLNLNRDYAKADAPEMHAMLRLLNQWDPILYVDLHVTDGAKFEHDVSYTAEPVLAGIEPIRQTGAAVLDELMKRATQWGSLPVDFYPSFLRDDDPASGFAVGVIPKRFSTGYWSSRNRVGMLVEIHSWKDYPTRVRITYRTIVALMEMAASDGKKWLAAAKAADEQAAKIGGTTVALSYTNTERTRTLEFRGYEYAREPSAISGTLLTRYNDKRPQVWRIPLFDEVKPSVTVVAPRGGYLVPASHARTVSEKLTLHGIEFRTLDQALGNTDVEVFRATKAKPSAATFEGRSMFAFEGEWSSEKRTVGAGALFVPIAQAKSQLAMTLLEPREPDSLASWGYFASAFEPKEYMEAYVAEEVGEEMLRTDPTLRREFERRLEDPAFARDPTARLEFFYRRHSSWDEQFNLYPVFRTATSPQ
ncbi:MAG: M14 family metallopeptidase [Steroidobacter sp.]